MLRLMLLMLLAFTSAAQAQVAAHCSAPPTLEALIADMGQQNLGGEIAFWGSGQTQVNLLLAGAAQLALQSLRASTQAEASAEIRALVADMGRRLDLPLPQGGPLLPSLRPQTADLAMVSDILTQLQVMEPWVDVPFSLALQPDLGLPLEEFRALWAQTRAYSRDAGALAYIRENDLILPRAIRSEQRFRPAIDADAWQVEALVQAILAGEITWARAENIAWGWLKAGDRIRLQAFALALKADLLALRQGFVGATPDFEQLEPFSGYFTAWQRWEDLTARLLVMLGLRAEVPQQFYHQSLSIGLGETEPNVSAIDASLLYAAWHASGYQSANAALDIFQSQRTAQDLRRTQDLYVFLQVLDQGRDLGMARLTRILENIERGQNARWLGGPLLMESFVALEMAPEALRAAQVAAQSEAGLSAPFAYVTPLVRIGNIELAQQVLSIFHTQACSRVAVRSERTYSWIEWLPLTAATQWRVPVSRFDGI